MPTIPSPFSPKPLTTSVLLAALLASACGGVETETTNETDTEDGEQAIIADPDPPPPPTRSGPITLPTSFRLTTSTFMQANFSVRCGGNADYHSLMAQVVGERTFRRAKVWSCNRNELRSASDAGVQPGQNYCWKVVANNETHEVETPLVCGTIPLDTRPVSAAPGLRVDGATQNSLDFYITDNSDNEGGFRIHARPPGGTWQLFHEQRWPGIRRHTPFGTEIGRMTDHRLQPDTAWEFRAEAFKEFAPHSVFGPVVAARTLPLVPTRPAGLRVVSVGTTTARLEWTDALYETRYHLHADQNPGSDEDWHFGSDITSFEATGLASDADVCFILYAHNVSGHGDSDYVCTHTQAVPDTELTASMTLQPNPPVTGVIPFGGRFPGIGIAQGTLLRVALSTFNDPALLELQFIAPNAPLTDCADSDKNVILAPGQSFGPAELERLYGTRTPQLPVVFRGCVAVAGASVVPSPRIELTWLGR